jgi:hypothetical protein
LIAGGPLILIGLYELWRRATLQGSLAEIRRGLAAPTWPWAVAWAGYFVLVVGGAAWLLIRRKPVSVIYNIDPVEAKNLIPEVVKRMRLTGAWRGREFWIEFPEKVGIRRVIVAVTVLPALRHLMFRWPEDSTDARRRIETLAKGVLAELHSPNNPTASWFLTAATGLFSLLLVLLALFVFRAWQIRG